MTKKTGVTKAAHSEQPRLPRVDPGHMLAEIENQHTRNVERMKALPTLADLVVETKGSEREKIMRAFDSAHRCLHEERVALEAVLGMRLSKEIRKTGNALERSLAGFESDLVDRMERAQALFQTSKDLPLEVKILDRAQTSDLLVRFGEYRLEYWRHVYRLPFVQDLALKELQDVAQGKRRVGTVVHSSSMKDPPEAKLVEAVKRCVREVKGIRRGSHGRFSPDAQKRIAEHLAALPLKPETLDEGVRSAEQKVKRLEELEISLACTRKKGGARGSERDAEDLESNQLSSELGGRALYARALVSDIKRSQEPYLRIKQYVTAANVPYVKKVVGQIRRFYWCRDDMLVEGMLGLMRAIEKFDPRGGLALLTYATPWIDQFAWRGYARTSQTIHIPSSVASSLSRLRRGDGSAPSASDADLAARLKVPSGDVPLLRPHIWGVGSLDKHIGGSTSSRGQVQRDERAPDVVNEVQRRYQEEVVQMALSALTPLQRRVLIQRFGLDGQGVRPLREIAKEMGVSPSRVQNLERFGLQALRGGDAGRILMTLASELD